MRLFLFKIVLFLFCLAPHYVLAQDNHSDQGEAHAHCVSSCSAAVASKPGWEFAYCQKAAGINQYDSFVRHIASGDIGACWQYGGDPQSAHGYPAGQTCGSRPQISGYFEDTVGGNFNSFPTTSCGSGCFYVADGPVGDACVWSDTNGNNEADDTEPKWCVYTQTTDGTVCSAGIGGAVPLPNTSEPSPNHYDCTNTQCVAPGGTNPGSGSNPAQQSGISGGPGPNPIPPGTEQTGSSHGAGDGDSSTPIPSPGGGGSQSPDGDCNPLSNPDCGYTGSAGPSGSCDELPTCEGDPVQCAILRQSWATACVDNGEVSIPDDCDAPATCDGDIVNCSSLLLARSQFCAIFGDTDWLTSQNPTTDADFDRDLKDEAESIDLSSEIDMGGFAGAGACPADYVVAVMGSSVNVSFTPLCDLASILRPLVIISSLLIGYMIIGGRR